VVAVSLLLKFHVAAWLLITSLIQSNGLEITILSVRLSRERNLLQTVRKGTRNTTVATFS
jgi:hypothetical protein